MNIETRHISTFAALALIASSVSTVPCPRPVAGVPARTPVVSTDAKGAPILLGRMIVTATPL